MRQAPRSSATSSTSRSPFALGALVFAAAGLGALGCNATQGTPAGPDTGSWQDDDTGVASDAAQDTTPPDVAPVDVGIYDAPEVADGNCELFPATDGPVQALQCDPGSTCDVSGLWPLCARSEDGGISCGAISCIGYGCRLGVCVGFND